MIVRTFYVSPDVIKRRQARKLTTEATVEFVFTDIIALMVDLLIDGKFCKDKKNYLWKYS